MTKLLGNVSEVNRFNTRASISSDFSVPNASLNTKEERIPVESNTNMECFTS